jgi:tellurite methyltransferase
LESVVLPDGLTLTRSTAELTVATLPPGLLAAHHLAASVWGVIRVLRGRVVFVSEVSGERRALEAGDSQIVEPEVRHHIEPSDDAALVIDFYR